MSDDLVKRLRWKAGAYAKEAADRIEQLAATNEELSNCVAVLEAKLTTCEEIGRAFEEDAGQLREKLAKFEAMNMQDFANYLTCKSMATLSELKGEK